MKKIAIIGAGISGLSTAHFLKDKYSVTIYEKENMPGGLIKCQRINGNLFHTCGGHVFNSKRQDVLNWFWTKFSINEEFTKAERNSVVIMESEQIIPYPIENHVYYFNEPIQKNIIHDYVSIINNKYYNPTNFEDFLIHRFGDTLYNIYFKPYNEKIWKNNLTNIPLDWLEGKLPMPTVEEMIFNNINHIKEKSFVHSTFWYEKNNGSQYIADKLAKNLNIKFNNDIISILLTENNKWEIQNEIFDKVIFCGNIKDLPTLISGIDISLFKNDINNLEYHGTTSVFCEIDPNPYSWIYLPSSKYQAHRIICTGNFAPTNNSTIRTTGTIEFTDYISENDIKKDLKIIPLHPHYITHYYNKYTYPIQNQRTKVFIKNLKAVLSKHNFFFTGRFADWEYYNMDIAIGAAMDLCNTL